MKNRPGCAQFFIILGAIAIIIGVILDNSLRDFEKRAELTTATITRIDKETKTVTTTKNGKPVKKKVNVYDVYVEYTVDGKTYNSKLGSYNSSMKEGKEIEIFYLPDTPEVIRSKQRNMLPLIIPCCIGVVITGLGVAVMILSKNVSKPHRLKTEGVRMTAVITKITENKNFNVNGAHPIQIECEITDADTDEHFTYTSDYTTEPLNAYEGGSIDVYVHREKHDMGYVDLDSVKKM